VVEAQSWVRDAGRQSCDECCAGASDFRGKPPSTPGIADYTVADSSQR
jgi:hypothetical protein